MIIDTMVLVMVVMAIIKGYSRGLIMALFNTLSLIIGLALAIKFSSMVSPLVAEKTGEGTYAPIVSFGLVFFAAMLVIRLSGKAIEKTFETVKAGFLNRLAGVVLYLTVYMSIFSILLYYFGQMRILSETVVSGSVSYPLIAPWGPAVINTIGFIIPWFQDMFTDLNAYFDKRLPAYQ